MKFVRAPPVEIMEQNVPVLKHSTKYLKTDLWGPVLYNAFLPRVNI